MTTGSERGWANLENPEIYADVQAAGSLVAALEQVADETGLDVGPVGVGGMNGLLSAALGEAPRFHRRPLAVHCGADARRFGINGWSRGAWLISGSTSALSEVAGAAAIWRSGASLAEIQRAFPWVEVSELAFAHERGPADAVAVQWSQVCAQMRDEQFDAGIRLVEAAYAEPRLRQLFPFLSHWVLAFSRCTGHPATSDVPWIESGVSEDRYRLWTAGWGNDRQVLGECATAEEAVALAVANLPEGCGAAVAGTSDEL